MCGPGTDVGVLMTHSQCGLLCAECAGIASANIVCWQLAVEVVTGRVWSEWSGCTEFSGDWSVCGDAWAAGALDLSSVVLDGSTYVTDGWVESVLDGSIHVTDGLGSCGGELD